MGDFTKMKTTYVLIGFGVIGFWSLSVQVSRAAGDEADNAEWSTGYMLETRGGIPFAISGTKPEKPAPTLIICDGEAYRAVRHNYELQCGRILKKYGYLCVAIDLPFEGAKYREGGPRAIAGWRKQLDAGENPTTKFIDESKAVMDYLIAEGYSDSKRIGAVGTSRGAFFALHLAAADPRVKCAVAIAPVTDLTIMSEFQGMTFPERARELSVANFADKLVDRAIWICVGDRDTRIGTDAAIAFARRLSTVSIEKKVAPNFELHVIAEPDGHTTPKGTAEQAAVWVARQLQTELP